MKIIEIAKVRSDTPPTDPKSVLEQRLADLEAIVRRRQKDWLTARAAAAAEPQDNLAEVITRERAARLVLEQELAARRAQYESDIARAQAVRAMVDEQLREAALEVERARHAETSAAAVVERLARAEADAVARLAEREAEFATELSAVTETRDGLEQQLNYVESALSSARQRHELAAKEVEQLTEREAELSARHADEAAARAALEHRIAEVEAALAEVSEQLSRDRAVAAERRAAYQACLDQEIAKRRSVEGTLASARTSHANAEEQHKSAMAAAAAVLAERETELASMRVEAAAIRSALERRIADARIALSDAEVNHRSAMATAAARLAEREAQFATELASITDTRDSLERQLRDVESQLTQETGARAALEQAITELRSAAAAAERRFREETATLAGNAEAARLGLEDQLSRERHDYENRLAGEQEQHRSAMAMAAARLAEREAQFHSELASITTAQASLEQQLRHVEAALARETNARIALERAIDEQRSSAADAEQRFRDEIAAITENARADRADWEDQLSRERHDHQSELADERQQHRSAMATAATRLAEREAQFATELASITDTRDSLERQLRGVESQLTQETGARAALEQAITELGSAAAAAERRFREETATLAETAQAERVRLEDQLSRERQDHQTELADEQQQHRAAMAMAATRLAEREAQFHTELASITTAQASLEQQLRHVEATLAQETEARRTLERLVTEARSAAAEAERRYREEIATLTANASAERTGLEGQIARERAQAADRLTARGAEFEAELKRLSGIHATALARFRESIAERDARIEEQGRASGALLTRLDASETENRRQFAQTPVPLIRCARDGALAGANFAFAALVGCRTPGELRDTDVAATLFESPTDLAWLIERSVSSTKTESVETTCIRKDGARVAVRLSARPSASGLVEIAVEDLTAIRVLEDKLREAHRLEAVGRVASEIAMTCEKLLRDVYREAQRLLDAMTGGSGQQDRAETLLDDVTLAGSILHQLVAYGDEQVASLAPVDVNRILHDLQPVLKQVAGDAITLELAKTSSPVSVDVNAERVERLLVNVASYGRQRMPHGGRLRIALSTDVVDGKFISQHPNVRQGPHALITVTEVARPAAEGEPSERTHATESQIASGRPGVDLGALQELISECGGHLWITAEPGGSMVVKMRLPLRAAWQRQADANSRHGLRRLTARLFNR